MWKCKDCDEYFDSPETILIKGRTQEDVNICPYCGCSDIIFYDEEKNYE